MLFYFIIFCTIGGIIGVVVKNFKVALGVIGAITLGWAFVYGPWALVTFIELTVGYTVAKTVIKEIKSRNRR